MALGGKVLFHDALWPLLLVRFEGVLTTPQLEAYLGRMKAYLERGEPFVSIFDSTGMTGVGPAEQRRRQAEWLKQHDAQLRELGLGMAFVISSPLVRLTLNVIFHLKPLPSPYVITATLGEAAAWAAHRLRDAGESVLAERLHQHFESPPRDK